MDGIFEITYYTLSYRKLEVKNGDPVGNSHELFIRTTDKSKIDEIVKEYNIVLIDNPKEDIYTNGFVVEEDEILYTDFASIDALESKLEEINGLNGDLIDKKYFNNDVFK